MKKSNEPEKRLIEEFIRYACNKYGFFADVGWEGTETEIVESHSLFNSIAPFLEDLEK